MGIYLNGIHISRKLSTEKGNYAQRQSIAEVGVFENQMFNLAMKFNSSTKV